MVMLIDSSVLIAVERGELDWSSLAFGTGEDAIAIAAVTTSELLHGAQRARSPAQRARREAFIERLLNHVPVVPFDLTAARAHARIWARLAARGIGVGAHDLLIAATALAAGGAVATRDQRSFPKIPGLSVVKL